MIDSNMTKLNSFSDLTKVHYVAYYSSICVVRYCG